MKDAAVFSPRVLVALVVAIAVTLAASLLLTTQGGEERAVNSVGANSYSHSAIGHAGFFELLKRSGKRAVRGQSETLVQAGANGLLVIAEPFAGLGGDDLRNKLLTGRNLLLVLPKWRGTQDAARPTWIQSAELVPSSVAEQVLALVAGSGDVVRVTNSANYSPSLLDHDPHLDGTRQLIANGKLLPIIATPDGVLLGMIRDGRRRIMVLSDPDIIANHGIGKYSNAALAIDIVEQMASGDAPIVFDETVHGFIARAKPSLKLITGFPYSIIVGLALAGVVLLLLATTGRFGATIALPPPIAAGKAGLIRNAALLIAFGGHHAFVLRRYAEGTLREAARQMRAPRGLDAAAQIAWLDKASRARGMQDNASGLLGRVENVPARDLPRLFAAARSVYFWKKELIHGSQASPHDH